MSQVHYPHWTTPQNVNKRTWKVEKLAAEGKVVKTETFKSKQDAQKFLETLTIEWVD